MPIAVGRSLVILLSLFPFFSALGSEVEVRVLLLYMAAQCLRHKVLGDQAACFKECVQGIDKVTRQPGRIDL